MIAFILHIHILDFEFTGTVQQVSLDTGKYVLECWGAQGGHVTDADIDVKYESFGSNGGYSRGTLVLDQNTSVFIYVGGKGSDMGVDVEPENPLQGGWNGGGSGLSEYITTDGTFETHYHPRPGGGATDISLTNSEVTYENHRTTRSAESINDRVIVAGGGAGSVTALTFYAGNEFPATSQSNAQGGGLSGCGVMPGTQNAEDTHASAGYGYGGNTDISNNWLFGGGGGGYYGGGSGSAKNAEWAGGGSGFVKASGSGHVLVDAVTIAGNQEFEAPGGEMETGHAGNGFARITCTTCPDEEVTTNMFSIDFVAKMSIAIRCFIVTISFLVGITVIEQIPAKTEGGTLP